MENRRSSDRERGGHDRGQKDDPIVEKVIRIDRINKVVKGGKRLAFRAFVIAGDQNGKVGLGLGKSKEVPSAIKKGVERARKHLISINIVNGTLPHEVIGEYGSAKVILKPARPGTGVIAGGAVRILLESLGLKNVVAKSLQSRNPINCAHAALTGLLRCKNLEQESAIRGKAIPVYQASSKSAAN
ncbi:30S ribosomal protein S5 [bacterium]|nr:30S ribosomal protein S5 [bacterium]